MDTALLEAKPSPKTTNDKPGEKSGRLGGARADFIGSLGRKVGDVRNALLALERDPAARGARDDVRRKLHALGTGARLLRFDGAANALIRAQQTLDDIASGGAATPNDLNAIARVLDDLPALAWDDVSERHAHPPAPAPTVGVRTSSALIVGEDAISMALSETPEAQDGVQFECERTTDVTYAVALAQEVAPDVVIVDADLAGADELVETLLDDPLTEPVPIVVLGRFDCSEQESRYIALGVAKTLKKPASIETLQAACQEAVDQHRGKTIKVTLGEPTVEQLADRLADELRRGLCGSLSDAGRSARVALGDGSDVLGAVKSAILRVQEVLSARTGGAVDYSASLGGAGVAVEPNLEGESLGADRAAPLRGRGAAADVRLEGRRVVVADDDPGVTWFIADLLRTTGCIVYEAFDGQSALELCYQMLPDLVVADVVMPKIDGVTLARMIERDVALKDTRVVLLSWKEDLLQRAQELGAGAAAYLRKESDARAILARVREALWTRARIEARLRTRGEVRGRLQGMSVRSLIEFVCTARRKARISVRDASYLYELEVREGAPCRVVRTSLGPEGASCIRGARALAAMLGVSSGRFVVTPNEDALEPELIGTLEAQLAEPLATARAAVRAIAGGRIFNVEGLMVDAELVAGYVRATPEPARSVLERVLAGRSPRQLLLEDEVCPATLERLLVDLASRGAIREVHGADVAGEDVLRSLVDAELKMMTPSAPPAVAARAPEPAPIPEGGDADESPTDSLGTAVMDSVSERSPTPKGFILPELRLRPSLFSVITRPAPEALEGDAPAGDAGEGAAVEDDAATNDAVSAGAAGDAPSSEAEAGEALEGEAREADRDDAAIAASTHEGEGAPDGDETDDAPEALAAPLPTPSVPVLEATDPPPTGRELRRKIDLTPVTPMTSVAVKPIAAKPRSERRWMGALALLGGIVLASGGTRILAKKAAGTASAAPRELESVVPAAPLEPAAAAPSPSVLREAEEEEVPVTTETAARLAPEVKPSAASRASSAAPARDAGASATAPAPASELDVAAAAVEYQGPRGLHRLP